MALQIRRGLEADRSSITPIQGELLYVTDTKNVYVGDGTTAGGTLVTGDVVNDTSPDLGGNLNLNGNDIVGTGNINITGTITATGNINLGDESADNVSVLGSITTSLTPRLDSTVDVGSASNKWRNGFFNGLQVDGEIDALSVNARLIADDSTISYNPATNVFNGEFTGNITATGTLDGEMIGSVFGDDSTPIIDGITGDITTNRIISSSLSVNTPADTTTVIFDVESANANSDIRLLRTSDTNISGDAVQYGRILFGRNDISGFVETASISGYQDGLALSHDTNGSHISPSLNLYIKDGVFAFGTFVPAAGVKVHVEGNLHSTGSVEAASFIGSVTTDDSTIIVDGIDGSISAQSFVQFGSLTTVERDALTAANGMVIYNTTNNKFEGHQNGGWINLDDGTAAS